jgi:hypothetical protein
MQTSAKGAAFIAGSSRGPIATLPACRRSGSGTRHLPAEAQPFYAGLSQAQPEPDLGVGHALLHRLAEAAMRVKHRTVWQAPLPKFASLQLREFRSPIEPGTGSPLKGEVQADADAPLIVDPPPSWPGLSRPSTSSSCSPASP